MVIKHLAILSVLAIQGVHNQSLLAKDDGKLPYALKRISYDNEFPVPHLDYFIYGGGRP